MEPRRLSGQTREEVSSRPQCFLQQVGRERASHIRGVHGMSSIASGCTKRSPLVIPAVALIFAEQQTR